MIHNHISTAPFIVPSRIRFRDTLRQLAHPRSILFLGILLRIIVFWFQAPFNNDNHYSVISFVYHTHALPPSALLMQSYHPPLYYLLASPLFPSGPKTVQILSLLFSIGSLVFIYRLVRDPCLSWDPKCQTICLWFACLLPQYVMFGNYISNDSLSIFLGSATLFASLRYLQKPDRRRLIRLSVVTGLGLSTKGTFLAFMPAVTALVVFRHIKDQNRMGRLVVSVALFLFISGSLGIYKYAENMVNYGHPIVHNLDPDPPWAGKQKPTYDGIRSWVDLNIAKLAQHPTVSPHTRRSYPLLFYGTFWYQYIHESNFSGNRTRWRYLGSLIYLAAIIPTVVLFTDLVCVISRVSGALTVPGNRAGRTPTRTLFETFCVLVIALNLVLVIAAGIRFDVWSCFQSRLLFASFFSVLVLLNAGLEFTARKGAGYFRLASSSFAVLFVLFLAYFVSEIGQILLG